MEDSWAFSIATDFILIAQSLLCPCRVFTYAQMWSRPSIVALVAATRNPASTMFGGEKNNFGVIAENNLQI